MKRDGESCRGFACGRLICSLPYLKKCEPCSCDELSGLGSWRLREVFNAVTSRYNLSLQLIGGEAHFCYP